MHSIWYSYWALKSKFGQHGWFPAVILIRVYKSTSKTRMWNFVTSGANEFGSCSSYFPRPKCFLMHRTLSASKVTQSPKRSASSGIPKNGSKDHSSLKIHPTRFLTHFSHCWICRSTNGRIDLIFLYCRCCAECGLRSKFNCNCTCSFDTQADRLDAPYRRLLFSCLVSSIRITNSFHAKCDLGILQILTNSSPISSRNITGLSASQFREPVCSQSKVECDGNYPSRTIQAYIYAWKNGSRTVRNEA